MSVVLTGAAGFLGDAVLDLLVSRGEHVVALDRRPVVPRPGVTVLTGDLLAPDALVDVALAEADAVWHLAGCPGVRDDRPDVALRRRRDNPLAAERVLARVPLRTPLVVTSSSSVYGGAQGRASSESDRLRPRGGYAQSKVLVEDLCAARLRAGGVVAVARPFTVAGEGQRADMAIARWITAASQGRPLHVLGGLDRTRDVTDVRQVAGGLVALAGSSGPVNIGTGQRRSLAELVDAVRLVTATDAVVEVAPVGPEEPADTWADPRRLERLTGLVCHTDLLDLVGRQLAAATAALAA